MNKIKDGIWWEEMWNPVYGCTKVSPACDHCYAERMGKRFHGHFNVTLRPEVLEKPLHWKRPRVIFVCGMSDLFHESVPDSFIDSVFDATQLDNRHTYIILTKRAERLAEYTNANADVYNTERIWFGVTAENQEQADLRIPCLLEAYVRNRFVSVEPLLGRIEISQVWLKILRLVICGGESGQGARPMQPEWARFLRDQCQAAGTPFFFKQWGEWRDDVRFGKHEAGRKLDGVEHLSLPWGKP